MHKTLLLAACLAVLAPMALTSAPAAAASLMPAACPSAKVTSKLTAPLARLAARLRAGEPVTIVAIGSSSTAGAGSTAPELSYPSRLQAVLKERFPGAAITVVNRGINGQDAPEMLARFERDVAAYQPNLVLWQAGVNALFRANGINAAEQLLRDAVQRTRAIGADMLIIDPQYAPRVAADSDTAAMLRLMDKVGAEEGVGVFHRYALMRDWHESAGLAYETFLWKDSFHMNDWGYDCFARDLGRAMTANIEAQQRSADVSPTTKLVPATVPTPASAVTP
ncbi:SGNH/GDSL hydrolase family protein [Ancylobacter sp. A5.8]|uniref:SGNH/GDSL hydrolase family protein n=1 Tax=Ancylobacter gelatini TaxID=2919920 RepID=UPI001F4E458F|nr:SGNH/GDSL hydrolase family protein [Ancylobacter gelatini]MCJ8142460.1 SGNH/GDSL hydrolase family protein [Ancylobacter gelatini]